MAKEGDKVAEWQTWERGVRRRSYIALPPLFRIQGFLGNRFRDLRLSEFSEMAWWAVTWAFAQLQPISPIFCHNLLLLTEYSPTSPQSIKAQ